MFEVMTVPRQERHSYETHICPKLPFPKQALMHERRQCSERMLKQKRSRRYKIRAARPSSQRATRPKRSSRTRSEKQNRSVKTQDRIARVNDPRAASPSQPPPPQASCAEGESLLRRRVTDTRKVPDRRSERPDSYGAPEGTVSSTPA